MEQVKSLRESAAHPRSKIKGVPPPGLNNRKQVTETNGTSTDSDCIADVAQEFVSRNDNRAREMFATSKSRGLR